MTSTSYMDLKKYCYFSSLSESALEVLASKLQPVEYPAGHYIVKEGEPADSFYLVQKGEVEVTKKNGHGQTATVSVAGIGEGFGEMALLTCSPRFCSVSAKTDVRLLKLPKSDFEDIVRDDASFLKLMVDRHQGFYRFNDIKTSQPFALLPPEKISALIEQLSERTFAAGEDIVVQGEMGDEYYIVKSGKAEVLKVMMSEEAENVATLEAGQGFGEEALLNTQPRSATVRAIEETSVWCISKEDFDSIARASFLEEIEPESVLSEPGHEINYLDIRMKSEYEDEHIPGAVNIPLDELRRRYSELDNSKEYYVYCLLGQRSATASFLMNSQGLRAKSIKGGIINWPGETEKSNDGVHTPFKPT